METDQAEPTPIPHTVASQLVERLSEMEAALAALQASWSAISEAQRQHIVAGARRVAIDAICDIETVVRF